MTEQHSGIWVAVLLNGESIVTVLAASAELARERIRDQLGRPGRNLYLRRWQLDGELVKERAE